MPRTRTRSGWFAVIVVSPEPSSMSTIRSVTRRKNAMASMFRAVELPRRMRPPSDALRLVLVSGFRFGLPKQQVGSFAKSSYASGYRNDVPTMARVNTLGVMSYRPLTFQTAPCFACVGAL